MHPSQTYGCGHPRTAENTRYMSRTANLKRGPKLYEYWYCRTCHNAKSLAAMNGKRRRTQ